VSGVAAPAETAWSAASLAALMLAVDAGESDSCGVGGAVIRGLPGPARESWLALLRNLLPARAPIRRVPLGVADGRLLGGLDLAATLRAGRPVGERGLLAETDGGVLLLAMAERLTAATVARVGAALDGGEVRAARDGVELRSRARIRVVALDEGMSDDEAAPPALCDRVAFLIDLSALGPRDKLTCGYTQIDVAAARARLPAVESADAIIASLCGAAVSLGVASIRAPLQALQVARIAAALAGRDRVSDEDAALAARLVLAPRATRMPAPPPPPPSEPPPDAAAPEDGEQPSSRDQEPAPPQEPPTTTQPPQDSEQQLDDMVLAAARAAIPARLLAGLAAMAAPSRAGPAGRSGAIQKSGARGRPAGIKAGEPRGGSRLNIVETLRAAAPWQRLRREAAAPGSTQRIAVRREDFRVNRTEQRSESTIIFVVDASRSSAVNRLAEAKGAVEMLLADCYVRRDRVAVLAFRGRAAELLLPPTRSLVRAKRQLAGLPGGGGTPLAAGLDAAMRLADVVRRRGETPTIVLLTDGRANIARDGAAGRERAETDARSAASMIRAARLSALLIDTAQRPQPLAARFAAEMGARYLPLPYADAASLSGAVRAAIEPSRSAP
jgi:magnesium chelatase subunit D